MLSAPCTTAAICKICKTPGQAPLGITPSHHTQSSTKMALAVTQHVWARAQTPVQINHLQIELSQHPNPMFLNSIYAFIAIEKPIAAGESILKELKQRRMAGPFRLSPLPNLQISPMGLVPKKGSSDTRLIIPQR